jgi:CRISPR-associated protein Cas5t
MRVLKISLEGAIMSFRYPNFMIGVQPTYEMPPPATIYGHLCSALGEWVSPAGIQFAYRFTYERKLEDLEHVHVLHAAGGKLPGTKLPKVQEGNINPFRRQLLFQPRLTLYVNRPEWESAFRSPRYAVALGRSQDLCTYVDVQVMELVPGSEAYFEHTLIPFEYPLKMPQGVVTTMPRFLDYENNRRPVFGRYIVLQSRVQSDDGSVLAFGSRPQSFWVDHQSAEVNGRRLGLVFHSFV